MAAALVLAVCGAWWAVRPAERDGRGGQVRSVYTDAEVKRAAKDLELVMTLTGRALAEVEQAAVQDALMEQVVPAMREVPMGWPKTSTLSDGVSDSQQNGVPNHDSR
jgi:hypothetical protein